LKRGIRYWLENPPQQIVSLKDFKHVVCDGTFLEQRDGIYAIMNAQSMQLIFAAYGVPEGGQKLYQVYQHLADAGLSISSATVYTWFGQRSFSSGVLCMCSGKA